MHTQLFLTAWNPLVTGDHFFAAVILLAVLLFAELVGIGVLTFKLLRVRRAKKMQERAAQSNELHYAVAPAFLLGAIPQLTSTLLTVLMLSLAAASLLLVALLIVFRSCGYEFLPRSARKLAKRQREEAAVISAYTEPEQADEPLEYVADAEAAEIELQEQASYAAASVATASIISYDEDETEEETDAFEIEDGAAEESEVEEAEEIEEVIEAEEVVEENVEEVVEEITAEAEPVAISGEVIPPAPVAQQPAAEPAPTVTVSGEQGPVKVVEKVVTETYKEIIREIPAESSGAEKASTSSERVIEKLTDLLEQALNLQKPAEAATAAAVAESTPVAAAGKQFDDEDDEDDEDDTDLDDATDAEDADDVDDEENDIAEDRFTGNERIIGFDDETGMYIVAHYRKSFEAKLIQARPNIKKYYSELKNALLSYKGSKSRISWTADSFHNGRASIAKINVKTRILEIYLALDPATLEGTVYRGKDVGSKKKYADTPFQYKIRTPRKFKWAMELVQRTCEEHGLTPIDIEPIAYDEQYPFDSTENLVERKLIKEYIRQEKPATTFELAEDHQTAVPDVDDSVIPANANFSWEFDNDMLNDPARDVEEASVAEIEVAEVSVEEEEPVAEAQAETAPEPAEVPASPAVYKETVKVTEMRYTERYYGDGQAPVTELAESTRELVSGNEGAETENEADAFTTYKFECADHFEAYRNDDLTPAEAVEAEEVAAEEIEAVEEVEEEIEETEELEELEELEEEVEVIEDLEESDEIEDDDQPVWTGLGGEPAEDVEYEEVVEYVEVDDDSAEDVEYEEVVEYVEVDDDSAEDVEYEEVVEYVEAEDDSAEDVEYEEVVEYVEAEDDSAEDVEYEEVVEYVEAEDDSAEDVEYEEVVEYVEAEDDSAEDVEYEEVVEYVEVDDDSAEDVEYEEVVEYVEVDDDSAEDVEYEEVVEYVEVEEEPEEEAPQRVANPDVAVVSIRTLEANFAAGTTIDLDKLKAVGLVLPTAKYLNVYGSGPISKPLTVEANKFTLEAVIAIDEAGGNSIMLT